VLLSFGDSRDLTAGHNAHAENLLKSQYIVSIRSSLVPVAQLHPLSPAADS
jgi:hypothetical protein